MCGIVGIIGDYADKYITIFPTILNEIRHRGPDEQNYLKLDKCILGHTRLSIIDLKTGSQPMKSSYSDKYIVFNGEIYGYKDLIDGLRSNYIFKTSSDTEVILALYEKYESDMLHKLSGMFSFAIWDNNKKELFAARDRFGEKPFYYAITENNELIFASEIKAIIRSNLLTPELDIDSLSHYLKYLYVHPNKTIYKNIHILPPAHSLIFKDGNLTINRYWKIPETNPKITLSDALDKFKYLLEKSVSNQLVADVPVGAFLSGGLDSSSIVSIASKFNPKIKTFSFGFEDGNNELKYAKQIAKLYNTEHYELTAESIDISELLLKMSEVYDEPFADSSNIPTYLISKLSRNHLKVILTGDGADELFGGYWWWYYPMLDIKSNNNKILDKFFFKVINNALSIMKISNLTAVNKNLSKYHYSLGYNSHIEAHSNRKGYFTDKQIKSLLNNKTIDLDTNKYYDFPISNSLNDALNMDIQNYMPGDILTKIDRASMANALELRAPFLDVEFASFCIKLPCSLKIDENKDKIILREAYSKSWTEEIQKRGKQGFGAPVDKWLNRDKMNDLKRSYLFDKNKKIYSLLSYEQVSKYFNLNSYQTWILLVLSIWLENHNFKI